MTSLYEVLKKDISICLDIIGQERQLTSELQSKILKLTDRVNELEKIKEEYIYDVLPYVYRASGRASDLAQRLLSEYKSKEKPKPEPKYKVGDKVLYCGKEVEITKVFYNVKNTDYLYNIAENNRHFCGDISYVHESWLSPTDASKPKPKRALEAKFKIGDIVQFFPLTYHVMKIYYEIPSTTDYKIFYKLKHVKYPDDILDHIEESLLKSAE